MKEFSYLNTKHSSIVHPVRQLWLAWVDGLHQLHESRLDEEGQLAGVTNTTRCTQCWNSSMPKDVVTVC